MRAKTEQRGAGGVDIKHTPRLVGDHDGIANRVEYIAQFGASVVLCAHVAVRPMVEWTIVAMTRKYTEP